MTSAEVQTLLRGERRGPDERQSRCDGDGKEKPRWELGRKEIRTRQPRWQ